MVKGHRDWYKEEHQYIFQVVSLHSSSQIHTQTRPHTVSYETPKPHTKNISCIYSYFFLTFMVIYIHILFKSTKRKGTLSSVHFQFCVSKALMVEYILNSSWCPKHTHTQTQWIHIGIVKWVFHLLNRLV